MKKCLIVCAAFYPAYKYGGPVRSLTNLVDSFDKNFSFDVITSDRDMGDTEPFEQVNVNSWGNKYGDSSVFYSSPTFSIFLNSFNIFKNKFYDMIYLNSFFDFRYSFLFLILFITGVCKGNKLILAPRGELTKGAMSIKPFKKKFYLCIFKLFNLHKRVTFQFTSEEEMLEGLEYLGDVDFKVVPNMHSTFPRYQKKNKISGELNIIFLSRISPKKNLLTIIESLKIITSGKISFTIAGTMDDKNYWQKCLLMLQDLPKNITIKVLGPVDREQVSRELSLSHLFFLPTLNENYGHAIVEAMMHSNIVLISDKTPWSNVVEHGGLVGNVADKEFYSNMIDFVLSMDEFEFNEKSKLIYKYCNGILEANVEKIHNLFS